jgi:hypothetical protein
MLAEVLIHSITVVVVVLVVPAPCRLWMRKTVVLLGRDAIRLNFAFIKKKRR